MQTYVSCVSYIWTIICDWGYICDAWWIKLFIVDIFAYQIWICNASIAVKIQRRAGEHYLNKCGDAFAEVGVEQMRKMGR